MTSIFTYSSDIQIEKRNCRQISLHHSNRRDIHERNSSPWLIFILDVHGTHSHPTTLDSLHREQPPAAHPHFKITTTRQNDRPTHLRRSADKDRRRDHSPRCESRPRPLNSSRAKPTPQAKALREPLSPAADGDIQELHEIVQTLARKGILSINFLPRISSFIWDHPRLAADRGIQRDLEQ